MRCCQSGSGWRRWGGCYDEAARALAGFKPAPTAFDTIMTEGEKRYGYRNTFQEMVGRGGGDVGSGGSSAGGGGLYQFRSSGILGVSSLETD